MSIFEDFNPTNETYWRAVILFEKNTASYKFALAKALLDFAKIEQTNVSLNDLAMSYLGYICEHLRLSDRQATNSSSTLIDACRQFNNNQITHNNLIEITKQNGFRYVFDAFHNVNQGELPISFFKVDKGKSISLTDDFLSLKDNNQFSNLLFEVESRWRLVETAWDLNISYNLLQVEYDNDDNILKIIDKDKNRRVSITSSKDALNGYQKGKCFYCFSDIDIDSNSNNLSDVDHFFPFTLGHTKTQSNLDGIWNLVFACKNCNRGDGGKFAQLPDIKYLERLHKRNNFLIESHHPLRETLLQ